MNDLINEIRIVNEWRTKDIARMKLIHSSLSTENKKFFLRICVPMIYAHWEGFVVNCLILTIENLNKLKLKHPDAHINIFVLSIGEKFKRLQSNQSFSQRIDFTKSFTDRIYSELTIDKKIDTKSNLNFESLKNLLEIFNLDINDFKKYESDIDQLVKIRNKIAHGENAYLFEMPQIEKYFSLLENLMDLMYQNLEKFVQENRYKSNSNNIIAV